MQNIRKSVQQGFTLIELMIVVAVIAVLAAIAIPQYQNYLIRAQVSEAMVLADGLKTPLTEYYDAHGTWPENAPDIQPNPADVHGAYVDHLTLVPDNGNIRIVASFNKNANADIQGKTFALSSKVEGGDIAWSCKQPSGGKGKQVDAKYLPTSCH